MDNSNDFYKERYLDIQRYAYHFLSRVPLTEEEQKQIIRKYFLGTDFVTVNSVQDYNNDWLIKGYVKVDIRDMEGPVGNFKGKYLDAEHFLKETMVQLPKRLFELDAEALRREILGSCMNMVAGRITEHMQSLRVQKAQIEEELEKYSALLSELSFEAEVDL